LGLKGWALATCMFGWICLAVSFGLTRVFHTDQWMVVVPLTIHLFSFLVFGWAMVVTVLWMVWLGKWQEDMAIATINLFLAGAPVLYIVWAYMSQNKSLTRFVLSLMWTGQ
jgi:hypothetical protein